MRKIAVEPGMRMQTTEGQIVTIATIVGGRVYAYTINGWLKAVDVVSEAWGGEFDMHRMNEAA